MFIGTDFSQGLYGGDTPVIEVVTGAPGGLMSIELFKSTGDEERICWKRF